MSSVFLPPRTRGWPEEKYKNPVKNERQDGKTFDLRAQLPRVQLFSRGKSILEIIKGTICVPQTYVSQTPARTGCLCASVLQNGTHAASPNCTHALNLALLST